MTVNPQSTRLFPSAMDRVLTKARSLQLTQLSLLAFAMWSGMYSRAALGPLQETAKGSLQFTDNEVALLQGMAMALPMVLGSIPLGILADRFSRIRLVSCCVAAALISFVGTAFAPNFAVLFVARCFAGLSGAGLLIVIMSLIGDLYKPDVRGRATMVMAQAEVTGAPVAFALGGALLVMIGATPAMKLDGGWGLEDWRWALLWMGSLVVPALLLTVFLREPERTGIVEGKKPPLSAIWPELWRYRAIALPILAARGMIWLADGALFVWGAPLLARKFHLPPDRVGALMGTALLIGGILGPIFGGFLADYCHRRGGPRRTVRVLSGVALLAVPAALFSLMPSATWLTVALTLFWMLGCGIATAGATLSIVVIPGELRGFYLGISFTVGSLFFVGLAPLIVSSLSGALGGEHMIGHALTAVCIGACVLGATAFALSARHFPGNVE